MTNNPLLDDLGRIPGTLVALPTRGLFYDEGVLVPSANPETIEVSAPTIMDELSMQDPFKVLSGRAIEDLIRNTCPDVLRPELLAKVDVDAIMVAAKISATGGITEMNVRCQNQEAPKKDGTKGECGHIEAVKVDLYQVLATMGTIGSPEEWQVEIKVNDRTHTVQIRPLGHAVVRRVMKEATIRMQEARSAGTPGSFDEIERIQRSAYDAGGRLQVEMLVDSIKWVRTSAGLMVSDPMVIAEYLSKMPAHVLSAVRDRVDALAAMTERYTIIPFKCPSCGHTNDVYVAQEQTGFFSRGSRAEAKRPPSISPGTQPRKPRRS